MMDIGVLDIINCIFQGVVAIAAVIGLWIAVRQISARAKVNLSMKAEFKFMAIARGESYIELHIHMTNLSMASVYVSASGIELWDKKKVKYTMRISEDSFELPSGGSKTVSGRYNSRVIDDKASLHDKIKIYAVYQGDKVFYGSKAIKYDQFKHESEKVARRVDGV